jgi:hypothetical protein
MIDQSGDNSTHRQKYWNMEEKSLEQHENLKTTMQWENLIKNLSVWQSLNSNPTPIILDFWQCRLQALQFPEFGHTL